MEVSLVTGDCSNVGITYTWLPWNYIIVLRFVRNCQQFFPGKRFRNKKYYLCPTEESGLLMSSLYVNINVLCAGGEHGG
jgi:hypothetical protein